MAKITFSEWLMMSFTVVLGIVAGGLVGFVLS